MVDAGFRILMFGCDWFRGFASGLETDTGSFTTSSFESSTQIKLAGEILLIIIPKLTSQVVGPEACAFSFG